MNYSRNSCIYVHVSMVQETYKLYTSGSIKVHYSSDIYVKTSLNNCCEMMIPLVGCTIVVLLKRVISALYGLWAWCAGGRPVQKPVQTTAVVLKLGLPLFLPENLGVHRLKHPGLHKGLAESDGFESRHLGISADLVLNNMSQNHIHSFRAQKTIVIDLQIVSSPLNLHLRLKVVDDVSPDVRGSERLPSHPAVCQEMNWTDSWIRHIVHKETHLVIHMQKVIRLSKRCVQIWCVKRKRRFYVIYQLCI